MKGIIYDKVIVSCSESYDGETPMKLYLTEEVNGYAVWLQHCEDKPLEVLKWFSEWQRQMAIEFAVVKAAELVEQFKDYKRPQE